MNYDQVVRKVLEVVDAGLIAGLGNPKPGEMCIEAAVCYAMGLPHSDSPSCVGSAVRQFKIRLNDASWSSPAARAAGMRKLAVAQLGSDTISQESFSEIVVVKTINQLLPLFFREVAEKFRGKDREKFLFVATQMEGAKTLVECKKVAEEAQAFAYAAVSYAYDATANADADAGAAAAAAAADAANASAAYVAASTAYAADAANASAAYVAAYADKYLKVDKCLNGDKYLLLSAEIGLSALKELKSPGCDYLSLCD